MSLSATTIERIIAFGGGVAIDATNYTAQQMERFAAYASSSKATLIIRNCAHLPQTNLQRIAGLGQGKVIFELDK